MFKNNLKVKGSAPWNSNSELRLSGTGGYSFHDFYETGYTGEASPVGFFMIPDKLAPAVFTFFPVSDYITAMALGI